MILDDMDKVLAYLYDRIPQRYPSFQISQDVFINDYKIPLSEILMHLMDDNYIYQWKFYPEDHIPMPMREQYSMTVAGSEFFRKAKFLRRPYHSQDIEETLKKEHEDRIRENTLKNSTAELWSKKYWWVVAILTLAAGFFLEMLRDNMNQKVHTDRKEVQKPK